MRKTVGWSTKAAVVLLLFATACTATVNQTIEPTAIEPTTEPVAEPTPEPTAAEPDPTTAPTAEPAPPNFEVDPNYEPNLGDETPLPIDDRIVTGTLENGLTYFVLENSFPGGSVDLRLAVDAGSMEQAEADDGVAHFLEHMMFNGTEKYPANDLERELQRFGVQIGPDLNAYTSYDETVYELNVPDPTAERFDVALDILHQWSSAAIIDPDEVVAERGVVREERRLRTESNEAAINDAFDDIYYDDTPYEERAPIGSTEQIVSTTEVELRVFYENWYRPDNMAVIIVGEIDAAAVEAQIQDLFGDLTNPEGAPPKADVQVDLIAERDPLVLTDPNYTNRFISLDFTLPDWDQGTPGGERLILMEDILSLVIENRLSESASAGTSGLIGPTVRTTPINRNQRIMGFNTDAVDLGAGTQFVIEDVYRLANIGVTEEELERATETYGSLYEQFAESAPTTIDPAHADGLVAHFLDGWDMSDPDTWLDRQNGHLDSFTTDELTNHLNWILDRSGPLVILVGPPSDDIPDQAGLTKIVNTAVENGRAGTATEGPQVESITELMTAPPAADRAFDDVVTEEASGTTFLLVSYDNGADVAFEYRDRPAGTVFVVAESPGGWSNMTEEEAVLVNVATTAVAISGIGPWDKASLDRYLANTSVQVSPYISETSEGVSGSAQVEDLEVLLQMMYLYLTEPRVDESALREAIAAEEDAARARATDPSTALFEEYYNLRYGAEPVQVAHPTQDDLDALTPEAALEIFEGRISNADSLDVVAVGDTDATVLYGLADRYIGSLPLPAEAETFIDLSPPAPEGIVESTITVGAPTNPAALLFATSSEGPVTETELVTSLILGAVFDSRLFDTLREQLGASYSGGSIRITPTYAPDEGFELVLFTEIDPSRVDEVEGIILDLIDDIATNGVSADELERAKAVVEADLSFEGTSDRVDVLFDALDPERDASGIFDRADLVPGIDQTDMRNMIDRMFADGDYILITRLPGE